MKLSLWLYTHRHGTDILKLLLPDDVTLSMDEAIQLIGEHVDLELHREDEYLEFDQEIPIELAPDTVHYCIPWPDLMVTIASKRPYPGN